MIVRYDLKKLLLVFFLCLVQDISWGTCADQKLGQMAKYSGTGFYPNVEAALAACHSSFPGALQKKCEAYPPGTCHYEDHCSANCANTDHPPSVVYCADGLDLGTFPYLLDCPPEAEPDSTGCREDDPCNNECNYGVFGTGNGPAAGRGGGACNGGPGPSAGDPVAVLSGDQYAIRKDLSLDAGTFELQIEPYFHSKHQNHSVHGYGWNSILGMRMYKFGAKIFILKDEKGFSVEFSPLPASATFPITIRPQAISRSQEYITVLGANGPYLYSASQKNYYFGTDGALDSITDGNGYGFRVSYSEHNGKKNLEPVHGISSDAEPAGTFSIVARDFRVSRIELLRDASKGINFIYNSSGYLSQMTDHVGRVVQYAYDQDSVLKVGRLIQVHGLEGVNMYAYADATHPYHLTAWNVEPFPIGVAPTLDPMEASVAITQNSWTVDGRVGTQTVGKRIFSWRVLDRSSSVYVGIGTCSRWITNLQQTIQEYGVVQATESIVDTSNTCRVNGFNYTFGSIKSLSTGKLVRYGSDNVNGRPWPFVRERTDAEKVSLIMRDGYGREIRNSEIPSSGPADTLFVSKKYDGVSKVVRKTQGKRFLLAGDYRALGDSVTTSLDYDSQGRFWREVWWNHPADSSQGSTVHTEITYNADGTIAAEHREGVTTTFDYSTSSYPGKPSRAVKKGTITRLYTYDALGRIATETDPRGGVTVHFYTAAGRDSILVSAAGDTTFSYWEGGRLVRKIANRKGEGTGSETVIKYDADGLDTATYVVDGGELKLLSRKARDAFGRVIEEGDAQKASRKKYAFNSLGNATGDTIWSDATTPLIHRKYLDMAGRDTAEILPNGDSVSYLLDGWGNKLATRRFVKVGTGFVQVSADSAVYDYDNQVLARFDSLAANDWKKTTFFYDMQGNLKRSVGPRLDTTLYGYKDGKRQWTRDAVSKWTWHITDTRGFDSLAVTLAKSHVLDTTTLTYSLQTGDHVTATQHDNAGNLRRTRQGMWKTTFTKAEDLPLVRATGYYPSNRVQADSVPIDIANGKWLVTSYEWNPTGELKKTSRTGGMVTEHRYNARGQKVAELVLNSAGSLDTTRTYSYDVAGRLVEERTPGLGSVTKRFDEANRVVSVTDSSGVRTGLRLDALGRVVADTNGLGYVAKHVYGPNADTLYDRNSFKTTVTRDALGRTTSIKDNEGNQTKFFYESKTDGTQRDSVAYPDGTWEVTVTDKGGRTIQKLDKRGVTQSFVYGNDWSMSSVRYEMATKPTLEVVYTRNAKGQVEKIERTEAGVTTAKTEYTFDDAGRVLSQKQTVGADIKTTGYAYDMARRSVTLTLPDGTTRTKVLDERDRLDSVYLDGAMVADYFYDNNKHTGTVLGNGIEAAYGRDAAGRLTSMAYGKNGLDPILRHDLGWDAAGQLKWTKKIPDAIADERYGMDQQGQLTEWKIGVLNASYEIPTPADSLGWNLDSRGNWTNVYDSKANVDTRAHSGANAINVRNGVTFVYDDAGNLLSDGANTYEWTLDGLLAKVTTSSGFVEYSFDGQKRLVKRVEKNTSAVVAETDVFVWDGWQLAQESRNSVVRTYAYGKYIDDQIAVKTDLGLYYLHRSYNQSAEVAMDANGNLVERYIEMTPYGGYIIQDANGSTILTSSIGNRSIFQGAPMIDPLSELVYLRNRWMSPELGRWISRDPIRLMGRDFSLVRFVRNYPKRLVDPFGLADLTTDMENGTTTFDPRPEDPNGEPYTIETRNNVDRRSKRGAQDPYATPDIIIPKEFPDDWNEKSYGPPGTYIDTGDPRGRDIHGGGSCSKNPTAPNQGWCPTMGCTRGQNKDVQNLIEVIDTFRRNYPGVPIPYARK